MVGPVWELQRREQKRKGLQHTVYVYINFNEWLKIYFKRCILPRASEVTDLGGEPTTIFFFKPYQQNPQLDSKYLFLWSQISMTHIKETLQQMEIPTEKHNQ